MRRHALASCIKAAVFKWASWLLGLSEKESISEAVDLETSLAALRASPQAQCAQPLCGRLRVRGAGGERALVADYLL